MTLVGNKYIQNSRPTGYRLVDIMRPSKYGNPFKIPTDGTREEVVRAHKVWWYAPEQVQLRKDALEDLQDCVLLCCCKPRSCHGDTIAEYVNRNS